MLKWQIIKSAALKDDSLAETPGIISGWASDLLLNHENNENYYVIVICRGECPTGGHGIAVETLKQAGEAILVIARAINPSPGDCVSMALTYPYQVLRASDDLSNATISLLLDS